MKTRTLTHETFNAATTASAQPVLVDFWASSGLNRHRDQANQQNKHESNT